jgi:hypothetical protein
MKPVFGEELMNRAEPSFGLDEEGELRKCYRPTGIPGVSLQYDILLLSLTRHSFGWEVQTTL